MKSGIIDEKAKIKKMKNSDWETVEIVLPLGTHEKGLKGVWRHFVSVLKKQDPPMVEQKMTLSFYMKRDHGVNFTGVQVGYPGRE